jgi:hypothetical protein
VACRLPFGLLPELAFHRRLLVGLPTSLRIRDASWGPHFWGGLGSTSRHNDWDAGRQCMGCAATTSSGFVGEEQRGFGEARAVSAGVLSSRWRLSAAVSTGGGEAVDVGAAPGSNWWCQTNRIWVLLSDGHDRPAPCAPSRAHRRCGLERHPGRVRDRAHPVPARVTTLRGGRSPRLWFSSISRMPQSRRPSAPGCGRADVVDAVGDHADTDPILAMRMLLQGRDQSLALSTPARQAIWATGSPSRRLTSPWKTLTYQVLRDSARDGRPIPRWLVAPTPLERPWAPLPVREDLPLHQGLAKLGVRVNERELLTA